MTVRCLSSDTRVRAAPRGISRRWSAWTKQQRIHRGCERVRGPSIIGRAASDRKKSLPVQQKTATRVAELLEPLDLGEERTNLQTYLDSWEALPSRFKLLSTAFLSYIICNMDKVNMSVAIIPMAHEFGWNATVSGLVQSAFFYGFMICQLPGGYLSTKFSGSRMLPIGVGLWSMATFGLPAVGGSVPGLCASRSLVGVGEALAPAAVADVVAKTIPPEERSRAVSFVNSGLYVGTILGLLTSPMLINAFGWPAVFYVFGGTGLVWVVAWELLVDGLKHSDPETYKKVKKLTEPSAPVPQEDIPWRAMIRCQPVQALMFTHFCSGWFHFTILSWLPSYFSSTLGLELGDAARISLMPPIAGIMISSFAGPTADALIARGWKTGLVRKLSQSIAFIGPSLCLIGASFSDSNEVRIALLTASIGLGSFCLPGLYCNSQDLTPKYAGFLLSMTTTLAALPGIIGVSITGAILDATDSWPLALFSPSILLMLLGAVVFSIYGRGHEIHFADNRPFAFEERLPWKSVPKRE